MTEAPPGAIAAFRPPAWLRNGHVQTLLAASALRRRRVQAQSRALQARARGRMLDCGDGVRLQGLLSQPPSGTPAGRVVLLHGWEGSAASSYMLDAGAQLLAAGWEVLRLNFRDHGGSHHLNRGIFHSCRLDEVVGAVRAQAAEAGAPVALAGFSLGGNFALRVALAAPQAVASLVAVCPVVDPADGLFGLERAPWIYHRHFLGQWKASLRRKQALFPDLDCMVAEGRTMDLRALTGALVERHTGFAGLDEYLDGYSIAGDRLARLQVPATILAAADDPVIPARGFRSLALPDTVRLELAPHGGHCAFLLNGRLDSVLGRYISAQLRGPR